MEQPLKELSQVQNDLYERRKVKNDDTPEVLYERRKNDDDDEVKRKEEKEDEVTVAYETLEHELTVACDTVENELVDAVLKCMRLKATIARSCQMLKTMKEKKQELKIQYALYEKRRKEEARKRVKYQGRLLDAMQVTDLRNNSISKWNDSYVMQYKPANSSTNALEPAVIELMIDIRDNPLMCDCNIYNLVWKVKKSFIRWSGREFLDIICQSPPQLFGKKVMYEIKMSEFICDVTDSCPVGCTCEDRPDSRTLNIDCRGIGLTEVPDKVPVTPYGKISMQLDDNHIQIFRNVNYLPFVYSVTMSNNSLQSVPGYVMNEIASKRDDARVDFSNNALTSIPLESQNMKYENVQLHNNTFKCSCEMLWMVDWINLAPIYTDKDINCTFEGELYSIISLDEDKLGCKNIGNKILVVVLSIVGVIVIALLITAKRCPYETKVLLYKVFRIHPSDKYQIDENNDKQYDMHVCFDENDTYVRQWVKKVLFRELEEKKPFYRLCAALRNAPSGSNAEGRLQLIDDSRRMLIILSEDCENSEWCKYEICHSETLEQNQGRIMYLLYDNCAEDFAKREPWLSKMKDRKTFRLHDRLLWSKLRYELPSKPLKRNIIAKH
ncbi:hypothetical protein ACF0H5_000291 [Mactra antiquata]